MRKQEKRQPYIWSWTGSDPGQFHAGRSDSNVFTAVEHLFNSGNLGKPRETSGNLVNPPAQTALTPAWDGVTCAHLQIFLWYVCRHVGCISRGRTHEVFRSLCCLLCGDLFSCCLRHEIFWRVYMLLLLL